MKHPIVICECGSPYLRPVDGVLDGCANCRGTEDFIKRLLSGSAYSREGRPRAPYVTDAVMIRRASWRNSKRRARMARTAAA